MTRLAVAAAALLVLAWLLWRVVRDGLPWDGERELDPTVPLDDWLAPHYAEHELAYREGAGLDEMRLAGLL